MSIMSLQVTSFYFPMFKKLDKKRETEQVPAKLPHVQEMDKSIMSF